MGEVVANFIGSVTGLLGGRRVRDRYKARRRQQQRIAAQAHLSEAPDWRDARGVISKTADGRVMWKPAAWSRITAFTVVPPGRWRVTASDLTDIRVVSSRERRSASHGDRTLIEVAGVPGITHFLVENDDATAVESILREHS